MHFRVWEPSGKAYWKVVTLGSKEGKGQMRQMPKVEGLRPRDGMPCVVREGQRKVFVKDL